MVSFLLLLLLSFLDVVDLDRDETALVVDLEADVFAAFDGKLFRFGLPLLLPTPVVADLVVRSFSSSSLSSSSSFSLCSSFLNYETKNNQFSLNIYNF